MHRRSTHALRALAAAVGVATGAAHVGFARGEDASEPLRLQFRREGACPDADAFFRALRARTTKVREARPGERARTLTVEVRESGRDSAGTLAITSEDGASTTSTRTVQAGSCADVVEAIALMAALAVDPSASLAPAASTSAPAPPIAAPPAPSAPVASAPPPVASAPRPPIVPPPPPPTAARVRPPPPAPSEPAIPAGPFALGGGAEATTLLGGRVALGVVASYEARPHAGPRLFVRVTRTLDRDVQGGGRTGGLSLTSGNVEPCPLRVRVGPTAALFPCARLAVGRLAAEGKSLTTPEQVTRTWIDVGATARLAWLPARWLSIEPRAELRVPVTRDRFYVEPDATVYRAPLVGFAGGIDAMLHFP